MMVWRGEGGVGEAPNTARSFELHRITIDQPRGDSRASPVYMSFHRWPLVDRLPQPTVELTVPHKRQPQTKSHCGSVLMHEKQMWAMVPRVD